MSWIIFATAPSRSRPTPRATWARLHSLPLETTSPALAGASREPSKGWASALGDPVPPALRLPPIRLGNPPYRTICNHSCIW